MPGFFSSLLERTISPTPTVTTPAPPTSTPSPVPTVTAVPTPTPVPTPTVQQELRANLGTEPNTLDPQRANALPDLSVIRQVFRGLLGLTPDLTLEPMVATEIPTVDNGGISPDGLTYTFKLRSDATWSDGQRVTAGDFVFTIKRLLDPQTTAPFANLFFAIGVALEFAMAGEADDATIQSLKDAVGVEAPDDSTLRITLSRPDPTFPSKSQVSRICQELDVVVDGFMGRPLDPTPTCGWTLLSCLSLPQLVHRRDHLVKAAYVLVSQGAEIRIWNLPPSPCQHQYPLRHPTS